MKTIKYNKSGEFNPTLIHCSDCFDYFSPEDIDIRGYKEYNEDMCKQCYKERSYNANNE